MAYYKVSILSMEAGADATVMADAMIQRRVTITPLVFVDIKNGHRTVVLGAQEVKDITNSAMTAAQKRTALRDLVKAKILAMGLDTADEACLDFVTLVPPPFDVVVRDV